MNAKEYSRQLQEKFELYLLALVFTILGLAVQTANFGFSDIADTLELFGWLFLLTSGVMGLSRLEWLPVAHNTYGARKEIEAERDALVQQAEAGVVLYPVIDQPAPAPIQRLIDDRNAAIAKSKKREERLEKATLRKYGIHKWCFVIGVALLVSSRGYPAASNLVDRHLIDPFLQSSS